MVRRIFQSRDLPWRQRVTIVVVNDNGNVLIANQPPLPPYNEKMLTLPGGGIEPGQTPEEAVAAELLEEVGVKVSGIQVLDCHTFEEPFTVLKPGEGTPVQIERRKLFKGVQSVAYFAKFERTINGGKGTGNDAMEWEWYPFHRATGIMLAQRALAIKTGRNGKLHMFMADAIRVAKDHFYKIES